MSVLEQDNDNGMLILGDVAQDLANELRLWNLVPDWVKKLLTLLQRSS